MCDPRVSEKNLSSTPYGTMLQMSRMLRQPTSTHRSVFSPDASENEEDNEQETSPPRPQHLQSLTTLQQMMTMQQQVLETQEKEKREREKRQRREIPSSIATMGIDPALVTVIYNLGFDHGLDKRDPIPPCGVCEERRRKNRIAAADQRKRLREEQEEQ